MPTAFSTRRLLAVTAILFLLILAFLAARVHAGADPTQVATPASSGARADPTPAPSTAGTPSGDGGYGGPDGGYEAPGGDPYSSPGGGVPPGLAPDPDPPATSAS